MSKSTPSVSPHYPDETQVPPGSHGVAGALSPALPCVCYPSVERKNRTCDGEKNTTTGKHRLRSVLPRHNFVGEYMIDAIVGIEWGQNMGHRSHMLSSEYWTAATTERCSSRPWSLEVRASGMTATLRD